MVAMRLIAAFRNRFVSRAPWFRRAQHANFFSNHTADSGRAVLLFIDSAGQSSQKWSTWVAVFGRPGNWSPFLFLVLAACSTMVPKSQITWGPYEEEQKAWPVQPSGLARVVDGFPIYGLEQFPSEHYVVLGMIHAVSGTRSASSIDERQVAHRARREGGQAALITKQNRSASSSSIAFTDYLIVQFKTPGFVTALERIDIFLALTAGCTNGYTGPGPEGSIVQYSPVELRTRREEILRDRAAILARPELRKQ
jgi:hypothetical protein